MEGEGNASDSADGNSGSLQGAANFITNGEVGQAFNFDGVNGTMIANDSANLRITNLLTIEAWVNTATINSAVDQSIVAKIGGLGSNNGYQLAFEGSQLVGQFNSPGQSWPFYVITVLWVWGIGTWNHVAFTYDQSAMRLYINGLPVATSVIGPAPINTAVSRLRISGDDNDHVYFDGQIDEATIYHGALTVVQLQDIYAAGSAGKCSGSCLAQLNMILGGNTNVITGLDAWQTNEFTFTATSNNMVLEFQPLDNGMLLDDIQLVQIPSSSLANFYLPEESLDKFAGENAMGDWKLEILDNRAGPPTSVTNAPNLVSWKMNVVFENTQPGVEPLTHAIPVTNCVPPSQVAYFSVAVPVWASYATNTLTALSGQGGQWLLNTNGLPLSGGNDFTLGPPPVNSPGGLYQLASIRAAGVKSSAVPGADILSRRGEYELHAVLLHPRGGLQHHHAHQHGALYELDPGRERAAVLPI